MVKTKADKPLAEAAARWALPAQQARSQAMRARILVAAEDIFASHGYEGARIVDIAAAAKCSVGAVYFRFKDKDALFFAIAESFAADSRGRLPGLLERPGTDDGADDNPRETLRDFVRATAANFRRHKGMFRAIVERGFDHPLAMETVTGLRIEMESVLIAHLGQWADPARADELTASVRVMTQMIYGFLLAGLLNTKAPTRIDDARAVDEAADTLIDHLTAKGFLP